MATIQHANLTDADGVHEPKGASSATENQVIVSNGDGTTAFKDINAVIGESYVCAYLTTTNQNVTPASAGTDYAFNLDMSTDIANNFSWTNTYHRMDYTGSKALVSRLIANISLALTGTGTPTVSFVVQRSTDGGITWTSIEKSRVYTTFSTNAARSVSVGCLSQLDVGTKLRLAYQSSTTDTLVVKNINFNLFGFTPVGV